MRLWRVVGPCGGGPQAFLDANGRLDDLYTHRADIGYNTPSRSGQAT